MPKKLPKKELSVRAIIGHRPSVDPTHFQVLYWNGDPAWVDTIDGGPTAGKLRAYCSLHHLEATYDRLFPNARKPNRLRAHAARHQEGLDAQPNALQAAPRKAVSAYTRNAALLEARGGYASRGDRPGLMDQQEVSEAPAPPPPTPANNVSGDGAQTTDPPAPAPPARPNELSRSPRRRGPRVYYNEEHDPYSIFDDDSASRVAHVGLAVKQEALGEGEDTVQRARQSGGNGRRPVPAAAVAIPQAAVAGAPATARANGTARTRGPQNQLRVVIKQDPGLLADLNNGPLKDPPSSSTASASASGVMDWLDVATDDLQQAAAATAAAAGPDEATKAAKVQKIKEKLSGALMGAVDELVAEGGDDTVADLSQLLCGGVRRPHAPAVVAPVAAAIPPVEYPNLAPRPIDSDYHRSDMAYWTAKGTGPRCPRCSQAFHSAATRINHYQKVHWNVFYQSRVQTVNEDKSDVIFRTNFGVPKLGFKRCCVLCSGVHRTDEKYPSRVYLLNHVASKHKDEFKAIYDKYAAYERKVTDRLVSDKATHKALMRDRTQDGK